MSTLKEFKHNYCFSLGTCHKYVVQLTDQTPTTYWYARKLNYIFKYVIGKYNPIKTVFVYLAVSETQFRIYRLDLHNSQTKRKKLKKLLIFETKLSNNVKTNIISKYDEC